jgi:hypothetical protein
VRTINPTQGPKIAEANIEQFNHTYEIAKKLHNNTLEVKPIVLIPAKQK